MSCSLLQWSLETGCSTCYLLLQSLSPQSITANTLVLPASGSQWSSKADHFSAAWQKADDISLVPVHERHDHGLKGLQIPFNTHTQLTPWKDQYKVPLGDWLQAYSCGTEVQLYNMTQFSIPYNKSSWFNIAKFLNFTEFNLHWFLDILL